MFIGVNVQLQDERAVTAGYLRGWKMHRRFLLEFHLVELAVKQMLAKQIRIAAAPFHGEVGAFERVAARDPPRSSPRNEGAGTGHVAGCVTDPNRLQVPGRVVVRNEADA
ncbi:hypothetical protein D3C85_1343560 [compost metagenome]